MNKQERDGYERCLSKVKAGDSVYAYFHSIGTSRYTPSITPTDHTFKLPVLGRRIDRGVLLLGSDLDSLGFWTIDRWHIQQLQPDAKLIKPTVFGYWAFPSDILIAKVIKR
jgi:hypothetical protein